MVMKRRLKRIENKLNPPRYAMVEDIIRVIVLKKQKYLTPIEEKLLAELESRPVHPDLSNTLDELQSRHKGGGYSETEHT